MPEQLTKYPDATLSVLKAAGAKCGEGAAQKILTQCPSDRFCATPGGELCVYGLRDIPQMTQISAIELAVASGRVQPATFPGLTVVDALFVAAALAAGFALGRARRGLNKG